MTVSVVVAAPWHRAHVYKLLIGIVGILIALQYLLNGALDRRSIETIFTINTSRPPQRAFIMFETATQATEEEEDEAVSSPGNVSLSSTSASLGRLNSTGPSPQQPEASASLVITNSPKPYNSSYLPDCPDLPPNLVGPIAVSKTSPDATALDKAFAKVKPGGRGAPEECKPRHRVAIVIPFRDRFQHLMTLLYNLHPLLQRQQLDYQIFVVEQEGKWQFNRAMLMNIGYVEALKERPFDCFIFHDVDLLPEDDRNLYNCPVQPRHMSVAVDKFLYRLPYADLFGGVSAMSTKHFRLVNGFSNVFWGWGGEDDDMANRIKSRGLHISRYPPNIARYKMLTHKKEKANPRRYEFLKNGKKRFLTDGLNNLQYELLDKKHTKSYSWFLVRLTPPSQPS